MNDNKDEYLTLQLENIKQLSKKFMWSKKSNEESILVSYLLRKTNNHMITKLTFYFFN